MPLRDGGEDDHGMAAIQEPRVTRRPIPPLSALASSLPSLLGVGMGVARVDVSRLAVAHDGVEQAESGMV